MRPPPTKKQAASFNVQRARELFEQRSLKPALHACREATVLDGSNAEAWALLGLLRAEEGKLDGSVTCFKTALEIDAANAGTWMNLALVLDRMGRFEQALESCDRALALNPQYIAAHHCRGLTLNHLSRFAEAVDSFDGVLAAEPRNLSAIINRGNALMHSRRTEEALAAFEHAIEVGPTSVLARFNRANLLRDLGRWEEAIESYEDALRLEPRHVPSLVNLGNLMVFQLRPARASEIFDTALAAAPESPEALSGALTAALHNCDWGKVDRLTARITREINEQKKTAVQPFTMLGVAVPPKLLLKNAARHCATLHPGGKVVRKPFPASASASADAYGDPRRLKIGYVSADFRDHAVARLAAEVYELHDRSRFEISAISLAPDDGSAMRKRLMAAFDRFEDASALEDGAVADLVRKLELDILVDLSVHTMGGRPGALASRPAPIQINFLGYPGTSGAEFYDYIVADPIVAPFSHEKYYSEKIIHLPNAYQPNDRKRPVPGSPPPRSELGLPDAGVVLCCFNNTYKITRDVYAVWMRVLKATPGSVLWLLDDNADARRQLRTVAEVSGIDPARVVFAQRASPEDHLRRHRAADLFVDTLPYNAHTTASDALWAGLPLVTWSGDVFQSRVAASLVTAAGLPELVTSSLAEYEALCLKLASDTGRLRELSQRLDGNRLSCALFDTPRFTRALERAYELAWQRHCRREHPTSFAV